MPYCRITIFTKAYGYQGWNPDPVMEEKMARLRGSGSFYWGSAKEAYKAAFGMMRKDPAIEQIKIETISGREVGRLYREEINEKTRYFYHTRRVGKVLIAQQTSGMFTLL